MMRMDERDVLIITQLRQNARMSLTKMSRKINVPVSTIFERLKINEKNLILKHSSLLDFSKLGYNARANIMIKVDKDDREGLKEFLIKHISVNSVCRINNGYDFLAEVVFRKISEIEEFNENLENSFKIQDIKAFFIIDELKKEAFMSSPEVVFSKTFL